jgi:hypothetical protein
VVAGLLPCGTLNLLSAKPKMGKSSLSRHLAQAVSQGKPFLGRATKQGEVMILSLEDPLSHTDAHLKVLGYNVKTDSPIHIATRMGADIDENLDALEFAVTNNPNLRLVIIDTLPKMLQVEDSNDYSKVQKRITRLHQLAKDHPHITILGLQHCKKSTNSDDVFDAMLGSTAFRGEASTNIVLHEAEGRRYIATETRVGRRIQSTELQADMVQLPVEIEVDYIANYRLGGTLEGTQQEIAAKTEKKAKDTLESRMIELIQTQGSATHKELMAVKGNAAKKLDVINQLVEQQILVTSGEKKSESNPLTYSVKEGFITDLYLMGKDSNTTGESA